MFDKDNKFGFIINNENNNNIKDTDSPHTISSKVLTTVPASNIKIGDYITINDVSFNKDKRYYIEFLGSKKLCSLISEENGNSIICSIGNYDIQGYTDSTNIVINIEKINEDDTTDNFTDLILYEEEVKYLDSKYIENDLVLQNSISLGRVGDIGKGSSAIGIDTIASGDGSHAEGSTTTASGSNSHAEGSNTTASGYCSHAEGKYTEASGESSHVEGNNTEASGENSHAEGNSTTASGKYAHAEGDTTTASGDYGSHTEGSNTIASGVGSHAEGSSTTASNYYSHAEGDSTTASGENSHSEGKYTTASGESSHAEGDSTTASAYCSHAEGNCTTASGENSHAEGASTIASSQNQHVQGKYNIEDLNGTYAHIVGNGEDGKNSNAHTLDWEGNAWFAGKLSQEGTPTEDKDLVTKKYVDDNAVNKYSQLNERPIEVFPYTEKLNKVTNVTQKLCTIDVADLKADTTYMCPDNCGRLVLQYTKLDNSKISFYMSYSPNSLIIQTGYKNDKQIEILIDGIVYTVTFKTATEEPKVEQTVRYLTDKNTTEYTPTGDYNPATKKYVDDKVASSPQLSFNESGELVVTINGVSKIFVPKSE